MTESNDPQNDKWSKTCNMNDTFAISTIAILAISEVLILDFWENSTFESVAKKVKMAIFETPKQNCQIWFHVKSEWQKNL